MKQEKVTFKAKDRKITGLLSTPARSKAGIIMAHSFKSSKTGDPIIRDAATLFFQNNFAVLRFDFSSHGESNVPFEKLRLNMINEELEAAVQFMQKQGFKKLGFLGLSLGALATILRGYKDIFAGVLFSPVLNPALLYERYKNDVNQSELDTLGYSTIVSRTTREKFRLGKALLEDFKNTNIEKELACIDKPLLILQGLDDKTLNPKQTTALSKKIENCKLVLVPDAGHDFLEDNKRKEALELALKWFNKYLK